MINQLVLSLLMLSSGAVVETKMRLTHPEELLRCIIVPLEPFEDNRMLAQCITIDGKEVRFDITGVYKL
jgi:hypothetical protein